MNSPATPQPFSDSGCAYASDSRPFGHAMTLAIARENIAISPIALLFKWISPSTVLWAVVAIAAFSVDCVPGSWSTTHIAKEVFKAAPPFAYSYTSRSIIFEGGVFRILAPIPHAFQSFIFGGFGHSMGCTSRAYRFCNYGPAPTATTLMLLMDEVNCRLRCGLPAITSALPDQSSPAHADLFNHRESPESFSRMVDGVLPSRLHAPAASYFFATKPLGSRKSNVPAFALTLPMERPSLSVRESYYGEFSNPLAGQVFEIAAGCDRLRCSHDRSFQRSRLEPPAVFQHLGGSFILPHPRLTRTYLKRNAAWIVGKLAAEAVRSRVAVNPLKLWRAIAEEFKQGKESQ